MSSLYADYIREITTDSILETDKGFATYRYLNEGRSVYIVDIFVKPEFRRSHIASEFFDTVVLEAKNKGCTEILGTIDPTSKNCTISLKGQLALGLQLHSVSHNAIILKKDI